ncbi:related to lysyl-tRNA synthetase (lysine--tRNA ligase) [Rhynchosporium secalis]|uniref:Lysyl-tRNA synthetase n=1 Tax=Rhynchosporium secalis TaxID=38038 RepID=A0A1E1MS67_RHYSE|nr:related to lysyl-tRNA synthetase (lysine--tRNA ligase) [Rhynchosporium secalis]
MCTSGQMTTNNGLRFLRPYLQQDLPALRRTAYLRFFSSSQSCRESVSKSRRAEKSVYKPFLPKHPHSSDVEKRLEELELAKSLDWPRIQQSEHAMTLLEFKKYSNTIQPGQSTGDLVVLRGRVRSCRVSSSKLVFIDIIQEGSAIQVVLDHSRVDHVDKVDTKKEFRAFYHLIKRGDTISVYGHPYVSQRGELSIRALNIPKLLSPSLASLPRTLEDRETRIRNRHVDMLVNPSVFQTLRLRSHIIQSMRDFLLKDNFFEVQTPLISDKAGGAIAKPFTTVATEFSEKQLALRIAPEIWLKRLVIGGMDRVFEIGPAFRNEGLDATHNPEFTTCEFYRSFTELEELMSMTEAMLTTIAARVTELRNTTLFNLPESIPLNTFTTPLKRLEFIPTIEAAMNTKLPELSSPNAEEELKALFKHHSLPLPQITTLPRLLDKLSSVYIEPSCLAPTFITHHPSCMAPLSKSFLCPKTSQLVSARAELFVEKKEIANMYEEENSPLEQREKFVQQLKWKDHENTAGIDESYLEALEYGLPPTGGWGAGVDRIVMMFSGAKRISDVLSFGSLRNVVNLGREGSLKKVAVEGKEESLLTREEKLEIWRKKFREEAKAQSERDMECMIKKAAEMGLDLDPGGAGLGGMHENRGIFTQFLAVDEGKGKGAK